MINKKEHPLFSQTFRRLAFFSPTAYWSLATMKMLFVVILALNVCACATAFRAGTVSKAYKSFEAKEFNETLRLISQVETLNNPTLEQQAELSYLKAQTFEALGQTPSAQALYTFICKRFPETQYAYLAQLQLEQTP
jgi:hypothetical protein